MAARRAMKSRCGAPRIQTKTLAKLQQVNREGNPLINELIIGTGFKDRFSMDFPIHDAQFANFVLEPVLAGGLQFAWGFRLHPIRALTC